MNNKIASVVALILVFSVITASAIAPIVIGAVGAGLIGAFLAGVGIDHFFLAPDVSKIIAQEESVTKANIDVMIPTTKTNMDNTVDIVSDLNNFSVAYVWAMAKYTYIKEVNEGKTQTEAVNTANQKVANYYYNITKTMIDQWNSTVQSLYDMASTYNSLSSTVRMVDGVETKYSTTPCDSGNANLNAPSVQSINVLDKTWYYKDLGELHLKRIPSTSWYCTGGDKYPDKTQFLNTLSQIDANYHAVIDNLQTYLTSVNATGVNVSDLIDPYILATQMNTDFSTTGYNGFAVAELALAGIPIAGGVNKTIMLDANGTLYEGWIFTDWETTFERNQTYSVPSGKLFYVVTEGGDLIKIPEGLNVTFLSIKDDKGNELNNTTVVRYVQHSGDASKAYEELEMLQKLYKEYLSMQTLSGGGSSIGDWWAGLSDTEKLAIAGAAVLFIVLIARR